MGDEGEEQTERGHELSFDGMLEDWDEPERPKHRSRPDEESRRARSDLLFFLVGFSFGLSFGLLIGNGCGGSGEPQPLRSDTHRKEFVMSEVAVSPQFNFSAKHDEGDRLYELGPQAVKDVELLGAIIGKDDIAECILSDHPKEALVDYTIDQLQRIKGFTRVKARSWVAAVELTRRGLHKGLGTLPVVSTPGDLLYFLVDIRDQRKEHFKCLYLNARNQVTFHEIVSIGSLSSAIVHPREVFRTAVENTAASIILAHNHPSGDTSPSQDDINLTRRLVQAGEILGIDILDHVIVGGTDFLSMKERGLI